MSLPIEMEINQSKTKIMEAPVKKRKRTPKFCAISKISPQPKSPTTTPSNFLSFLTMEHAEEGARCLILLSKGITDPPMQKSKKSAEKRLTTQHADEGGDGHKKYECKTCFKTFPSFQALGGHRASHKKRKVSSDAKKVACNASSTYGVTKSEIQMKQDEAEVVEFTLKSLIITSNGNIGCNNKIRVHKCSICQAEYKSGQALGGHMRRHRPLNAGPVEPPEAKTERNTIDLNMPAKHEMFLSPSPVFSRLKL